MAAPSEHMRELEWLLHHKPKSRDVLEFPPMCGKIQETLDIIAFKK